MKLGYRVRLSLCKLKSGLKPGGLRPGLQVATPLQSVDFVLVEDLILLHRKVQRAYAGQCFEYPLPVDSRAPVHGDAVVSGREVCNDPVENVGRNRALGKGQKAPVSYVRALGGESLETVSTDLDKASVVSDREIWDRLGRARPGLRSNTDRNVHSGQRRAAYGAGGGDLLRAHGDVRQKANN